MTARDRSGAILVAVLLLSLATWTLLAGLLMTAYLEHQLALGADRSTVAKAAAAAAATRLGDEAIAWRSGTGQWPVAPTVETFGACDLELVGIAATDTWWRATVRGGYAGTVVSQEVTVHAR